MTAPADGARRRQPGLLLGLVLGAVMVLIAAAVAVTVGRGGGPDATASVPSGGTQTVAVQLADMRISPSVLTVPAGTHVILQVINADTVRHDLHIDGGPETPLLAEGETARLDLGSVQASLAGWCTVPGHKAAGMTMAINATGSPSAGGHDMSAMPTSSASSSPIDFHAAPGPDWRPYNPALQPAPDATEHKVTFRMNDTDLEVAPGVRQTLWTYNGTAPGPALHGRVGDVFTVTLVNDATMTHGIDFHAGSLAPDQPMRSIGPGESLVYQFKAEHSGAWLYHCSTMPMTLHIANGMFGAVIIDPPNAARVDREFALVQSELYLGAQDGTADEAKISGEHPDAVVFNGYVNAYDHAPIRVRAGERIRVWIVDAGPQRSTSFHVIGTQFDTVFKEGAYLLRPNNPEHGAAQALDLAPGQGGFVEFVLPEPGHYPLTDHAMVDAERGAHGIFLVE